MTASVLKSVTWPKSSAETDFLSVSTRYRMAYRNPGSFGNFRIFFNSEFAEDQKVVQRALVHAMEFVLVTVEKVEVVAGGHFLVCARLDIVGGSEFGMILREKLGEGFVGFITRNFRLRKEAVAYGVLRGTTLSLLGDGSAPEGSVGSGCRSGSENCF
jgi:hypothetical protein